MKLKEIDYELIYIDDGSKDKTLEKIKEISINDKVKYISFSKNFGKDAAIYAGLNLSTWPTCTFTLASSANLTSRLASSTVATIGFSIKTCFFFFKAKDAHSK